MCNSNGTLTWAEQRDEWAEWADATAARSADMTMAEAIAAAARIGTDAGQAAASWAFDGNTTVETYRAVLAGIEDGDPMILDAFGEPGLDGEGTGARDLCDEIGVDYDLTTTADVDRIADAYLDASRESFWAEVERTARTMTDDGSA